MKKMITSILCRVSLKQDKRIVRELVSGNGPCKKVGGKYC